MLINLDALKRNYLKLAGMAPGALCAAAVKADAYGIGADRAGPALWRAGCRDFFVAHLEEAVALRPHLPKARIYVLHGPAEGESAAYLAHDLIPVLNSLPQIDIWTATGGNHPAVIHVDTGMNRLGLGTDEVAELIDNPDRAPFPVALIMSHLACGDEPGHEMNALQQARFSVLGEALRDSRKEAIPLSLANSAGVLLGANYHFDMLRPGIGLYGGNPLTEGDNPLEPVISLQARVLQTREVRPPAAVGYGAVYRVSGPTQLATLDVGYADGFLRAFGEGRWVPEIGGHKAPIVGRISMDMTIIDVSAAPPELVAPGMAVPLIDGVDGIDRAALATGLSAYELLTLLGHRYKRSYVETNG
nr:alanine racemase [Govania unica]